MKKIDKTEILAIVYKNWIDELDSKGEVHPEYNSSKGKYYNDIVANLLWIQKGVCAYSEITLCNSEIVNPINWKKGKAPDFETMGQLDHYDPTLKKDYGWSWDNFFFIHTDVNTKVKGSKQPNYMLKPDTKLYVPENLLQYEIHQHIFIPNQKLTDDIQQKVKEDIQLLGLNYEPIIGIRKEYLTPKFNNVIYQQSDFETEKESLNQFQTAFILSKEVLV